MLKLIWTPVAVAAPSDDGYKQALDELGTIDPTGAIRIVQRISRVAPTPIGPAPELAAAIDEWIGGRTLDRVTLMVHGFSFDPTYTVGNRGDDPYQLVYARPDTDPNSLTHNFRLSWLPIVGETDDRGTDLGRDAAIAFAWVSEGSFSQYASAGWNNPYLYAAFDLAPLAARALSAVIAALVARNQKFDILAHSLGTRAVSQAIGMLRESWTEGILRRAIFLGGAEYCVDANAALPGLDFEIFNLADTEDSVLTWLAHSFSSPVRINGSDADRVIGCDGLKKMDGWLDLQINRKDVRDWAKARYGVELTGSAIPGDSTFHPRAEMNHWVYYMDPGNRRFVSTLLGDTPADIASVLASGCPAGIDLPYYGQFNPAIPPTPASLNDRIASWSA